MSAIAKGVLEASAPVVCYDMRLDLLRAALHAAALDVLATTAGGTSSALPGCGGASVTGHRAGPLQQFEAVLAALLAAWEEVKTAEEARAKLEGELFKHKAHSSSLLTEEASPARPWAINHVRPCVSLGSLVVLPLSLGVAVASQRQLYSLGACCRHQRCPPLPLPTAICVGRPLLQGSAGHAPADNRCLSIYPRRSPAIPLVAFTLGMTTSCSPSLLKGRLQSCMMRLVHSRRA
jgi:hypothetical protein